MPAFVFLGAVLTTQLFFSFLPAGFRDRQGSDYTFYYLPTARNLVEGKGYTTPTGMVQTRVPPGYPLLLAAAQGLTQRFGGDDQDAVLWVMSVCMGLGATTIFVVARMLWDPLSALISSALWMTCPLTLFLSLQRSSEAPFMPLLYCATGLLIRGLIEGARSPALFCLVGVVTGCAMLIRPIAIGLGVVFALVLWILSRGRPARARMTLVLALLLGNAAAIIPWEAWVYQKTRRIVVLSDAGSSTMREGWTFGVQRARPGDPPRFDPELSDLMRLFAAMDEGGSLRTIVAVLAREIPRHPGAVARLVLLKLARPFYGTESARFEGGILLLQAFYIPLLLVGGWRSWGSGPAGRVATVCVAALVLYFWGMAFLTIPLLRFMTPVQGLAFILVPGAFRRRQPAGEVVNAAASSSRSD